MARRVKKAKGRARSRVAAPIKKARKPVASKVQAGRRPIKSLTPASVQSRKRPARVIQSTVSRWVRQLDPESRAKRLEYLYRSLKEVRKFYSGFEARDGFKLNDVKALTASQAEAISKRAQFVRELQSRPNVKLRPRSKKSKALIARHVGQERIKGQKTFIYHTLKPERERLTVRGNKINTVYDVTDKRDGKRHRITQRNYYFPMTKRFRTWEQLMIIAEETIKHLPPGRYSIVSTRHADIGAITDKKMLLQTMQNWFDTYGGVTGKETFAEDIIGFRWIGMDYKQTDRKQTQADQIRANFKKAEEKRRRRERALARKRLGRRK